MVVTNQTEMNFSAVLSSKVGLTERDVPPLFVNKFSILRIHMKAKIHTLLTVVSNHTL